MGSGTTGELRLRDGSPASSAWSLTDGVAHINHGSFGGVPRAVQGFQAGLKQRMEDDPVAWFAHLPDAVDKTRDEVAAILGADPSESVLVPNATAGVSTVYKSLTAEDVNGPVFVTDHGYGAVSMGAKLWADRMGVPFEVIHVPLDATPHRIAGLVEDAIAGRGGVLVIDHVTSPTAMQFPVREICSRAREHGVLTIVDAAHVPGLIDNPVPDVDCDFWIGNLHKYACSPRGCAILVVKNDRLRQSVFPLIDSWGTPLPYPDRFRLQGTLDATGFLAAPAAYRFIEEQFGWESVREHIEEMADEGQRLIADAFGALTGEDHIPAVGSPSPGMRLVRLPKGIVADHEQADALRDRIVRELRAEVGVTEFDGTGYLRISAHAYNTPADYRLFCENAVPQIVAWAREAKEEIPR